MASSPPSAASSAGAAAIVPTVATQPPPYTAWDQQLTQMTTRLGVQPEHLDNAKYADARTWDAHARRPQLERR